MLNQKGFSPIIIIVAIVALLGIGFYAGTTVQKPLVSNVNDLVESPKPSASPNGTKTPSNRPNTNSTSKAAQTPLPTPISISTPSPTSAPAQTSTNTADPNSPTFIKVTSPNGGESFKVGDTIHTTWSSNNLNKNGSCIVILVYDNGSKSSAWVPVNTPNGYYDWKLASEAGGHQAKVDMQCYDSNSNGYNDQSDNYFTVTN